jgi:hypothetical protein
VARREATEIHDSTTIEAEQILVKARAAVEEVQAQATAEAEGILAMTRRRIPLIVGPPNPALAREEARRAAAHLLEQAKCDVDGVLTGTK